MGIYSSFALGPLHFWYCSMPLLNSNQPPDLQVIVHTKTHVHSILNRRHRKVRIIVAHSSHYRRSFHENAQLNHWRIRWCFYHQICSSVGNIWRSFCIQWSQWPHLFGSSKYTMWANLFQLSHLDIPSDFIPYILLSVSLITFETCKGKLLRTMTYGTIGTICQSRNP